MASSVVTSACGLWILTRNNPLRPKRGISPVGWVISIVNGNTGGGGGLMAAAMS